MFVVGNLVNALAWLLDVGLNVLLVIVLVSAVLSWIRPDPRNPIVAFLDRVSDAVCDPVRRLLPTTFGGLDVAPLLVMLAIVFVQKFVVASLHGLAFRMGAGG